MDIRFFGERSISRDQDPVRSRAAVTRHGESLDRDLYLHGAKRTLSSACAAVSNRIRTYVTGFRTALWEQLSKSTFQPFILARHDAVAYE